MCASVFPAKSSLIIPFTLLVSSIFGVANAQKADDFLKELQKNAVEEQTSDWIHWGDCPGQFSNWQQHANRLVPVYSFGMTLQSIKGQHSAYRSEAKIKSLYGPAAEGSLNEKAEYFDQTQLFDLQQAALKNGKKNIILVLFDGMDWQNTQAAAIYKRQSVTYSHGRGNVLSFQTYAKAETDFGYCVTSSHNEGSEPDVDSQTVSNQGGNRGGGYSACLGGETPWCPTASSAYLMGQHMELPHVHTDSAAAATAITTGRKTYNSGIAVDYQGNQLETIAHQFAEGWPSGGDCDQCSVFTCDTRRSIRPQCEPQ